MTLKQDIFDAVSQLPQSITELSARFGVTRNAIVVPMRQLEAEGLVERRAVRRDGAVGKPTALYAAASGREDQFSMAFQPFAEMQASGLTDILSLEDRAAFYARIGTKKGQDLVHAPPDTLEEGVVAARRFADEMGAATTLEEDEEGFTIVSHTCPIASVVRVEPCACVALQEIFSEFVGRPVESHCQRGDRLTCRFRVPKR